MTLLSFPAGVTDISLGETQRSFAGTSRTYSGIQRVGFHDTFDWRLFEKDLILSSSSRGVVLSDHKKDETVFSSRSVFSVDKRFWWNLDDANLAEVCSPVIGVRALLKTVSIAIRVESYDLLDRNSKVVLRFEKIALREVDGGKLPSPPILMKVLPLKGYARQKAAFLGVLRRQGFADTGLSLMEFALEQSGKHPGARSSRVELHLVPDMPAQEAVLTLLERLLAVMKRNIDGILQDTDTEFLHDFRVALRRSRSVLGQMRNLFEPESCKQARNRLTQVQKKTNRLRDLDVALLNRTDKRFGLPGPLQPGLDLYLKDLERSRKDEWASVSRYLQSAAFKRSLASWESFLAKAGRTAGGENHLTVREAAKASILKRTKKIDGFKMTRGVSRKPARLHALRIDCKKLRYLLEFFASLFGPADPAPLIAQLKKLQTALGDFNDLSVQMDALAAWLGSNRLTGRRALMAGAAIGGLMVKVSQEQNRIAEKLVPVFHDFVGKDIRSRVASLFETVDRGLI